MPAGLDGAARVARGRAERAALGSPVDPALCLPSLVAWWSQIERCVVGQQLYLEDVNPAGRADIVIDNNDLEAPVIRDHVV